jgi:hypothetical protein
MRRLLQNKQKLNRFPEMNKEHNREKSHTYLLLCRKAIGIKARIEITYIKNLPKFFER